MQLLPEATRYCELIEQAGSCDRQQLVAALASALSDLLSAATRLPDVFNDADFPHDLGPSHEEWTERFDTLQRVLGDWDEYWTTLAPVRDGGPFDDEVRDAVMLPLADALADIWRDLKNGLVALDAGVPSEAVTWEWRQGFYWHWGHHATEALRVLHARLRYTYDLIPPEQSSPESA